ncbi:MAG TPA: pilin [Patescibacteria group bacterium]|nr:pilin [Patescibacteria group bacterium]
MPMRSPIPARHVVVCGFFAMLSGFLFFAAEPALAITIVPSCARAASLQTPGLDCVLATFRNVASLIVGITGSFALLMFVYGGFMLLTSAGVESRVTTGKTILKNAMIGLVLVFTAGYLIDYGVNTLRGRHMVTVDANNPTYCNDGRGRYVDVPGRSNAVCQTPCTAMAPIYSCQAPGPNVSGCNVDFTGCGEGMQCCITPAPDEGSDTTGGGADEAPITDTPAPPAP